MILSSAKITLIGFHKMFDTLGDDLFKNLQLPEGIDKSTLTDNILLTGGEFEVLYSDPEFLQNAIGVWSKKWYRTFDKWITALNIDFEPLENYDRKEDWTDTHTNRSQSEGVNEQNTHNSEYSESNTNQSGNDTVKTNGNDNVHTDTVTTGHDDVDSDGKVTTDHRISAFNQPTGETWTDDTEDISVSKNTNTTDTKVTVLGDVTTTLNDTETTDSNHNTNMIGNSSQNSTTNGSTRNDSQESGESKHTARIHGNIGVTTSTQMLEDYLRVEAWNIYEHITDIFLSEFVIPLY